MRRNEELDPEPVLSKGSPKKVHSQVRDDNKQNCPGLGSEADRALSLTNHHRVGFM